MVLMVCKNPTRSNIGFTAEGHLCTFRVNRLLSCGSSKRARCENIKPHFECLANRVMGWPEKALVGCFIGGLKDEIAAETKIIKPENINVAIRLARMQEEKLQRIRRTVQPPCQPNPPPQTSHAAPPKNYYTYSQAHLMQAHRENGLCYNCDENFGPGHKCKNQQIFPLEAEAEMEDYVNEGAMEDSANREDMEVAPAISSHALSGYATPQTMRVLGWANQTADSIGVDRYWQHT